MKTRLIIAALICAFSLSACSSSEGGEDSKAPEASSAASAAEAGESKETVPQESRAAETAASQMEADSSAAPAEDPVSKADEGLSESLGSSDSSLAEVPIIDIGSTQDDDLITGYVIDSDFELSGKWKYIKIDKTDRRSSGLKSGDYYRQHENDSYKVFDFRRDHLIYNETDGEYYPYTYYYYEMSNPEKAKEDKEEDGIENYADHPGNDYNEGVFYFGDDIHFARVAEDKLYGENFILIRISKDPGYQVSASDKELLKGIVGEWMQVNGGADYITYTFYADGSVTKADPGDHDGPAAYGIRDGVLYIYYFDKGVVKYTLQLSDDSMTLNGEEDYHRNAKDGFISRLS